LHAVLSHLDLERWVRPVLAADSYNWELMKILETRTSGIETNPCFDFCFLDGAHTWETDGFAFLMVNRLLRPDHWIVFDDVGWSFETSPALRDSERIRKMAEEERVARQIRKVVDLLARPAGYEVRLLGNVALAFKPGEDGAEEHRGDFDQLVASGHAFIRELAIGMRRRVGGPSKTTLSPIASKAAQT
jgi:hypothetical protein